jgi:hypothetical protein
LKIEVLNKGAKTVTGAFFENEDDFFHEMKPLFDYILSSDIEDKVVLFKNAIEKNDISNSMLSCLLIWGVHIAVEIYGKDPK